MNKLSDAITPGSNCVAAVQRGTDCLIISVIDIDDYVDDGVNKQVDFQTVFPDATEEQIAAIYSAGNRARDENKSFELFATKALNSMILHEEIKAVQQPGFGFEYIDRLNKPQRKLRLGNLLGVTV